jgi:hypothetical protein
LRHGVGRLADQFVDALLRLIEQPLDHEPRLVPVALMVSKSNSSGSRVG